MWASSFCIVEWPDDLDAGGQRRESSERREKEATTRKREREKGRETMREREREYKYKVWFIEGTACELLKSTGKKYG